MALHHVVTGALVRGDRLLLCHRSPSRRWYPNVWDLPGGHVDAGESELEALRRELREEVGVEAAHIDDEPCARIRGGSDDRPEGRLEQGIWIVRAWSGEPVNLEPLEHDEIRWASLDDMRGLALGHEDYLGVFEQILRG